MLALYIITTIFAASLVSSAHYVVGKVSPALDTTSPNGRTVVLWNVGVGPLDNLTDTIGPTGNSGADATYLIDCELLSAPCQVNDVINVSLVDDGSGYLAKAPVQVTITGAGFDIASNISMNSPPSTSSLIVDDQFPSPANEIDLTPATNTSVLCSGVITDADGISDLNSVNSEFYSLNSSSFGAADDNNDHYTNSSCELNTSYGGPTEASVNCTFHVEYYANAEAWSCLLNLSDNAGAISNSSYQTSINPLLALGANDSIDFGEVGALTVSNESVVQVVNYGNVEVNLSLSGFGTSQNDGYSMVCDTGNIFINETKYNLSASNPGPLTYSQMSQVYKNLSSNPVTEEFHLASRLNDTLNKAFNNTYWRVHTPKDLGGNCTGNIIIGATQS